MSVDYFDAMNSGGTTKSGVVNDEKNVPVEVKVTSILNKNDHHSDEVLLKKKRGNNLNLSRDKEKNVCPSKTESLGVEGQTVLRDDTKLFYYSFKNDEGKDKNKQAFRVDLSVSGNHSSGDAAQLQDKLGRNIKCVRNLLLPPSRWKTSNIEQMDSGERGELTQSLSDILLSDPTKNVSGNLHNLLQDGGKDSVGQVAVPSFFHSPFVRTSISGSSSQSTVSTDGDTTQAERGSSILHESSLKDISGFLPGERIQPLDVDPQRKRIEGITSDLSATVNCASFIKKTPCSVPMMLANARGHYRKKKLKLVSCYILGPVLGEGTFSVVRDAIDTSANRAFPRGFQRVAIKTFRHSITIEDSAEPRTLGSNDAYPSNLLQTLARSPLLEFKRRQSKKIQSMLVNEVRNLQCFHCPNIIRGIDIFSRNKRDYVVLPFSICSLQELIEETVRSHCTHSDQDSENDSFSFSQQSVQCYSLDKTILSEPKIDMPSRCHLESFHGESKPQHLPSVGDDGVVSFFSAEFVRGAMYQLLHGVAYLHSQGLAHNDLKAENILLFADGVLKISDLGSVSKEYNDQGTPMYISPEVCRSYYGAENEGDEGRKTTVNALKNDMWCCGVILYQLLVGKPLWGRGSKYCNRYQLFRHIASLHSPIDLGHVSEPIESGAEANLQSKTDSVAMEIKTPESVSPSSLRHLLSRLLDVNPDTRLTSEEAIHHPSLQKQQRGGLCESDAISEAQRDVERQVLSSPYLQVLIKRDREQHLQFVAECCYMLGIAMPEEIFIQNDNNVHCENGPTSCMDNTVLQVNSLIPKGTVDRSLFTPEAKFNYYARKLDKAENDVRFLLNFPGKVNMMEDYLFTKVLVECGYGSAEGTEKRDASGLQIHQKKKKTDKKKLVISENEGLLLNSAFSEKKPLPATNIYETGESFRCFCSIM